MGTKENLNLPLLEQWGPVQQVGTGSEDRIVAVNRIYECNGRWEIEIKTSISCYYIRQSLDTPLQ
jgi:hypothetical protein